MLATYTYNIPPGLGGYDYAASPTGWTRLHMAVCPTPPCPREYVPTGGVAVVWGSLFSLVYIYSKKPRRVAKIFKNFFDYL